MFHLDEDSFDQNEAQDLYNGVARGKINSFIIQRKDRKESNEEE